MRKSKAQIVATIGPAVGNKTMIGLLIESGADIIRLNFSWGKHEDHAEYIKFIRECAATQDREIKIIQDLSGPRVQTGAGHGFDLDKSILTDKDLYDLEFGLRSGVDYIAQSFVGGAGDVLELKKKIFAFGYNTPVIAKIERQQAVAEIGEIIKVADSIMVARGDLGNEVPVEQIPLIEKDIISLCKKAGKPVIVATQMLFSMVESAIPTRADITDIEFAILCGADAVMLSDETAIGKYPIEAVQMMEKAVVEAEKRLIAEGKFKINSL